MVFLQYDFFRTLKMNVFKSLALYFMQSKCLSTICFWICIFRSLIWTYTVPHFWQMKFFLSAMCYYMRLQMFSLWKSFNTYFEDKWVFSSMSTCMFLQITTSYKSCSTFHAYQWFSSSKFLPMTLKPIFLYFFGLALLAVKWLFTNMFQGF